MTDVAIAADLIREVAGPRGPDEPVKSLWFKAHRKLVAINSAWTERRVRAFWHREAMCVRHREIREMRQAIADRQAIDEARLEHRDFCAETERLAALLQTQDAAFHGPQIEALERTGRRMDRTRTETGD